MELKISLSCKFCSESKFTPQIYILESNAAMYPVTFSHCNKNIQTYNRGEREDYFKGYNGRLYVLILCYQYWGYLRMITEWVTFNKTKPEIYFPSLFISSALCKSFSHK